MENETETLRELISRQVDVEEVLRLHPLPAGRWVYLIQTPYGFPKYAVGTTDSANDDVRLLYTCGLLESAEEEFTRRTGIARPRESAEEFVARRLQMEVAA